MTATTFDRTAPTPYDVLVDLLSRDLAESDARALAALTPEFNTVRERYAELRLVPDASGRSIPRRVWFERTFRVFTVTQAGAPRRTAVGSWAAQDAERVAP